MLLVLNFKLQIYMCVCVCVCVFLQIDFSISGTIYGLSTAEDGDVTLFCIPTAHYISNPAVTHPTYQHSYIVILARSVFSIYMMMITTHVTQIWII